MSASKVGDVLRKREKNGSFEFTADCIYGGLVQAGFEYDLLNLVQDVMEDIRKTHDIIKAPQSIEEMGALGPRYKAVKKTSLFFGTGRSYSK